VRVATARRLRGRSFPGRRRADADHACGLIEDVMELMRRIGGDVNRVASANRGLLATERSFQRAFEKDERLLEVVAMRRRPTVRGNMHIDDAIAAGRILTRNGDGVRVADQADVGKTRVVLDVRESQLAREIVGRQCGIRFLVTSLLLCGARFAMRSF